MKEPAFRPALSRGSTRVLLPAQRHLVDLLRGVARLLVYPHHCFLARALRQAEDLAGDRVGPPLLEVHALRSLDREVGRVRSLDVGLADAEETVVNIHELRHL